MFSERQKTKALLLLVLTACEDVYGVTSVSEEPTTFVFYHKYRTSIKGGELCA